MIKTQLIVKASEKLELAISEDLKKEDLPLEDLLNDNTKTTATTTQKAKG